MGTTPISDQLQNILNKLQQIRDKAQEGQTQQSTAQYSTIDTLAGEAMEVIE